MKQHVLELFCTNETLVQPDAIDYIISQDEPIEYARNLLKNLHEHAQMILTIDAVKKYETEISGWGTITGEVPLDAEITAVSEDRIEVELPATPEQQIEPPSGTEQPRVEVRMPAAFKPIGKEYDSEIEIISDVTGNSTCEGGLQNFTKYFNDRFKRLRKIIKGQRREVGGAIPIARAKHRKSGSFRIIGMVSSVRETKTKHKLIELEDENDKITAILLNRSPQISVPIVVDDVIGIEGKFGKEDLIYIEHLIYPDVPFNRTLKKASEPVACAFISDLHVGSKTFTTESWQRFLDWLNGKIEHEKELAEQIKYLIVPGDAVEGIGVYPDQERELEISDIFAQYEQLAKYLAEVPDYIKIIVQPGNHDAVRPAEPQPTFPPEITNLFSSDIVFVGNPCYFSIHEIEILSYHGRSMDDFVLKIPKFTYNRPLQVMQAMLTRRHLAPIYGEKTPIAPEYNDYLVIDKVPDIFVTGHVHKAEYSQYKGITLINASAWQTQTSYQKMLNFHPDPAKAAVVDLSTREFKFVDFLV